jgi:hypothetical protein
MAGNRGGQRTVKAADHYLPFPLFDFGETAQVPKDRYRLTHSLSVAFRMYQSTIGRRQAPPKRGQDLLKLRHTQSLGKDREELL